MMYAKKYPFSRTYPLLVALMLMFARASASLAAVPQASSGAQELSGGTAIRLCRPTSDPVQRDREGCRRETATGPVQLPSARRTHNSRGPRNRCRPFSSRCPPWNAAGAS
jgi:hypothetical protein